MPPHNIAIVPYDKPKISNPFPVEKPQLEIKENYGWNICQAILNMVGRLCIGLVVGFCIAYALRNGVPLNTTSIHIILCVLGYQLLMAEACLALAPGNWTSNFTLVDKKRVHWILQLAGSTLAITGSIIKSLSRKVNWTSLHGKFALVAMVFTGASLVNGLISLYAYELRRFLPGNLSKLTHICFGVVAFLTACVSLIYGIKKRSFQTWMPNFYEIIIWLTCILIIIVIVNPLLTFYQKSRSVLKS